MKLLILPGDGIGPEITQATETALNALADKFGLELELDHDDIGLASLASKGETTPASVVEKARQADGVLLGPVSSADYPPPEQGGTNPSAGFRLALDLYANIRPSRTVEGMPSLAKSMDLILVRENTEGFYADRNMVKGSGEFMATEDHAFAIRKITREGSERIARVAADLAMTRRKRLTVVHKANVLKLTDGLFCECVDKVAADFPELEVDDFHVDAMASLLVREPERFDVIVTTNMFGDILSNLAAEMSGGLGLGGSINASDTHAIAQAAHGSAPDIAGQDIANPAALMRSMGQLLEWYGERQRNNAVCEAARALNLAVDSAIGSPSTRTRDVGGDLGTRAFGQHIASQLTD